jgi:demethylmenaquinone methyltransferase/2-methoxy-6-polyprenyl-1,4-benzoquinol methylase
MAKIMESEIQDAGLVILKNAGHYSYLDKFQHFCIVIDNFLKSITYNPAQNSDRDESGAIIKKMFSSIAHRYDLLNGMLSFGRDKYWRRFSINKLNLVPGEKYIDIAAGTGDMAIEIANRNLEGVQVVAVDFSKNMIDIGKKKINALHMDGKVKFQLADSQSLPFDNNSFHSAVCAFGVRNFSNKLKGIKEMRRVIKKNGQIIVLEFFKPKNRIFRFFYYFYFKKALPLIGGIVSGKFNAYHYLPTSVMDFCSQDELKVIMLKAGLRKVNYFDLTFGAVSVHIGYK